MIYKCNTVQSAIAAANNEAFNLMHNRINTMDAYENLLRSLNIQDELNAANTIKQPEAKRKKQSIHSVYASILNKIIINKFNEDNRHFENRYDMIEYLKILQNYALEVNLRFIWIVEHLKSKLDEPDTSLPKYLAPKCLPTERFILKNSSELSTKVEDASRESLRDVATRLFKAFCDHPDFVSHRLSQIDMLVNMLDSRIQLHATQNDESNNTDTAAAAEISVECVAGDDSSASLIDVGGIDAKPAVIASVSLKDAELKCLKEDLGRFIAKIGSSVKVSSSVIA
jgi:hypothetical protein